MGLFDFLPGNNENNNLPIQKIEVEKGLFVSKIFADRWNEIVATRLDYIKIKATPSSDIKRRQSFFGYYPFLPKGIEYPVNYQGECMFPLAQINFSETPFLKGYPEKGILQFFISMDNIYGLDFGEQDIQKGFCVRYYENIDNVEIVEDMSFIDKVFNVGSGPCPLYDSHKLSFNLEKEYIGLYNIWLSQENALNVAGWIEEFSQHEDELVDEAMKLFSPDGHKIGGYANFTQSDPRIFVKKFNQYILLFQMDNDEKIMWGDAGVGNFFIHPEDLAKRDFSKVMYNWDCS
jgi:uncharacterized protein YwqG